jgi:putative tryptophan/tyrosine transport system substrate-binding protein
MRRRTLLGGLVAMPALAFEARAQQAAARRIGVLTPGPAQWEPDAVLNELQKLGHQPGRTLQLDIRSADNDLSRLPALAAALVDARVDLIVAANTPAAQAAIAASSTIPIVIGVVADPVLLGFTTNMARPGGNITGVSNMAGDLVGKRLQVFKEAVPTIRRIVAHYHPEEPISAPQMRLLDEVAGRFGVEFQYHPVRTRADVEASVRRAADWRADALMRLAGQGFALGPAMAELALARRLPAMVLTPTDVRRGGLISYFADHSLLWRRVAHLAHRVLAGEAPGNLPFEQPTKFDLVINLKTAKALGITIPEAVLASADEVIE